MQERNEKTSVGLKNIYFSSNLLNSSSWVNNQIGRDRLTGVNVQSLLQMYVLEVS